MRIKHLIIGFFIFGIGIFLILKNTLYVIEFTKGGLNPVFILIGLIAAAAAFFYPKKSNRKINIIIAFIFLFAGGYGLYDEYYATLDFIKGLFPPLLIIIGLGALTHGIKNLH